MAQIGRCWSAWLASLVYLWAWGGVIVVLVSADVTELVRSGYLGTGPPTDTRAGNIDGVTGTPGAEPHVPRYDGRLFTVNSRYHPLIEQVSAMYDVDDALVKAVVQAESAFDPDAVSREGAQGLMQVLPATAARYAIENLTDPLQNLHAGVRHLKRLLRMFNGNMPLALAAYNAGENAVKRFDGIPPYGETLVYVGKVLGLWKLYARQVALYPPTTVLSKSQAGISG